METLEQELFDPAVIVQIYNSNGTPQELAKKFKVKTWTIARIKGGAGFYQTIIEDYLLKTQIDLWRQEYGYDALTNYFPPPWGRPDKKPKTIQERTQEVSREIICKKTG